MLFCWFGVEIFLATWKEFVLIENFFHSPKADAFLRSLWISSVESIRKNIDRKSASFELINQPFLVLMDREWCRGMSGSKLICSICNAEKRALMNEEGHSQGDIEICCSTRGHFFGKIPNRFFPPPEWQTYFDTIWKKEGFSCCNWNWKDVWIRWIGKRRTVSCPASIQSTSPYPNNEVSPIPELVSALNSFLCVIFPNV